MSAFKASPGAVEDLLGIDDFQEPPSHISSEDSEMNITSKPDPTTPQSSAPEPEFDPKSLISDASSPSQRRTTIDMSGANINFFSSLQRSTMMANGEYDVIFPAGKVGITLEPDVTGRQCLVKGFPQKKLGDVDDGLAKRSGVICIGDCIVAIDGESVLDLTFLQTMNRLRNIQDKSHTLTFRSSEHLKNLSQHTANSPFGELNETRKMIHREKEKWYLSPQTDDMCYCYVERTRGVNSTSFNLYREDTGEFMLAATINKNMSGTVLFSNMKESYLRKIDDIVASEDSSSYLGCMTTNFLGDEFTIHDHRADPKKCESKDNKIHHELGLIRFEKNILGRVPNFMTVVVPRPEAEDERSESRRVQNRRISDRFERKYMERKELNVGDHIVNWFLNPFRSKEEKERIRAMSGGNANSGNRPRKGTFDEKEDTFGGGVQTPGYGGLEEDDNQDLLIMNTKKPSWNKRLNAWTLNFSGRVKKASKKNFLLIAKQDNHSFESNISDVKDDRAEDKTDIDNEESGATVYVRFGKFTKHRFVLDFSAPMSSIVALGIAVSCFTKKLTVT